MRGLERGLERAGVPCRTLAYVEIEAFIVENLANQMENGVLDAAPIWSNLKTFPWENFRGKVHGITGGYPCQPFSFAGRRGGTDDPRHLFPHIARGIEIVRPRWCFFENVPGHLNLGYEEVRGVLQGLGYTVKEGIFSAEEVGAPHQRKRLFILAVENAYYARSGTSKYGTDRIGQEENQGREGLSLDRLGGSNEAVANPHSVRTRAGFGEIPEKNGEVPHQRNHDAKPKQSGKDVGNSRSYGLGQNNERRWSRVG